MSAFLIDAFEFSRHMERREGEIAVADLPRLTNELADKSGVVRWSLQGGSDKFSHAQLKMSVSGVVQLMCQRCLTPFAFDVESHSTLILAKDDAAADEIDALLDDDAIDVIVGSKALDVASLIEDEALLALPFSAKHEVCPDQAALGALKSNEKASPFAVLKDIKQ